MRKIRRYGAIVRFEHWMVALSGIMLIFTGLGCLPLFKRYYITEIPGFKWTADFYLLTKLHYIFAIFFLFAVFFHVFFHALRKDFGLLPKKGDFTASIKMILASFGLMKEPPADKWLPEQRLAYVGIGLVTASVVITGIIKVLKNLQWFPLSPKIESLTNLLHTIFGGLFIFLFFIHIFFVLAVKANWPLLKAMITGRVDEEYVKERHPLWYERIKHR
uniref:Cytochrome b/b6 domain-containing protein n=2 Tax=Caldimicrobium thiodismutans TaxID=1653476 RepID=A0A832LWR0_9BACT